MQNDQSEITPSAFSGLELLSSAVVLVDDELIVRYLNPGAENLFAVSCRKIVGYSLRRLLGEPAGLGSALNNVPSRPGSAAPSITCCATTGAIPGTTSRWCAPA